MDKKKPLGVKIIFYFLALTVIFGYSHLFATLSFLNSPTEKKAQLMQAPTFKRYDFKSTQDFDNFHKEQIKRMLNPWWLTMSSIQLILAFGLWYLKKWSRVGILFYSIFAILWFLPGAKMLGIRLVSLAIYGYALYYLTRPNVKELFK